MFNILRTYMRRLDRVNRDEAYSVIAKATGYHHRSPRFHKDLGRIFRDDVAAGRPVTVRHAVRKDTRKPGRGFYIMARSLGVKP